MTRQAQEPAWPASARVVSVTFGPGRVEVDRGATVLVRFPHGFEECDKSDLSLRPTPERSLEEGRFGAPLEAITRLQAFAIESVNDTWGVFSRSRVALLPHQLWVCRQVNRRWPTRWLVADDVGLGKTVEAGLILWPLISNKTAQRVLILCPASLTGQWQERLRVMFDLRFNLYATAADTPKGDFWGTNDRVIASLQTLRDDHKGRHARLLEGPAWDLVIVDEAHHLSADESRGASLAYRLVNKLNEAARVRSMVFFTGTPHRGKNYGFIALLSLLRPDVFTSPKAPLERYLPHLREVMIRNNKQNVTSITGERLFQPPRVTAATYAYNEAESRFYRTLTEFILTGKAYAGTLGEVEGQAVMLVLISLQKLASSSVAAVRRALKKRLGRIGAGRAVLDRKRTVHEVLRSLTEAGDFDDGEQLASLEEEIADIADALLLMQDEEPRLRQLIALAEGVGDETKIGRLMEALDREFSGRSVLFFTEYKATQSLLMSVLIQRYGEERVGFINGDDRAEGVLGLTLHSTRERAAERFNAGELRFLVSTEAAGEGIDLQHRCHTLVHIDLPWNPMRLHQRVGRLNRYGQTEQVDVLTLRNPDTVESLIWEKLNQKISLIQSAFDGAMDDPEDLASLVLGMTPNSVFRDLFAEGQAMDPERETLDRWFDYKSARFGGHDAIDTVRQIVGNSARFDFSGVGGDIPRLDLPDLKPFFLSMLALNRRNYKDELSGVTFKTPDAWLGEVGVRTDYDGMVFDRLSSTQATVLGVGHKLVDGALHQAKAAEATIAGVSRDALEYPLLVYRVADRVTTGNAMARSVMFGVTLPPNGPALLKDWELLERLNGLGFGRTLRRVVAHAAGPIAEAPEVVRSSARWLAEVTSRLDLPYRHPEVELMGALWPVEMTSVAESETGDDADAAPTANERSA